MKTHFTSNSASLTALAVAELNTKGRELKGFHGKPVADRRPPVFKQPSLEDLAKELVEFDLSDLERALEGRMDAEEALRRLISSAFVYECSPGRYRIA